VGIRSDNPWSVPSVEELANKLHEVKFEVKIWIKSEFFNSGFFNLFQKMFFYFFN